MQTVLDTEEFLEEHLCHSILKDTLRGLQFLHSHSIAHLDIKVKSHEKCPFVSAFFIDFFYLLHELI